MNNRTQETEHIRSTIKRDKEIAQRIERNQMQVMEDIQEQIDAFYGRYATSEGITVQQARRRVSQLDMDKLAQKTERYVREGNFTARANRELELYNLSMRTGRLELLKANIRLELLAAFSEEERILIAELTEEARAEFRRQAGILGETIQFNERNIRTIANADFLTATWSDRLWDNQDALRSELERLLNRGIVQGINPRVLARELRGLFNTSVYNSNRLMITEMARVQTDVQKESFQQSEFEEYRYIAEPTACPVCADLNNKTLKVSEMEAGVNASPLHPFCKCSTSAYMDRAEWDRKLRERGL